MDKIEFGSLKTATLSGKTYIGVNEATVKILEKAGLEGRDAYNRSGCWNFLGHFCRDQKIVDGLKQRIPENDTRPLVFHLTDNIGSLKSYKGPRIGGKEWNCVLVDKGEVWLVVCTNSPR